MAYSFLFDFCLSGKIKKDTLPNSDQGDFFGRILFEGRLVMVADEFFVCVAADADDLVRMVALQGEIGDRRRAENVGVDGKRELE